MYGLRTSVFRSSVSRASAVAPSVLLQRWIQGLRTCQTGDALTGRYKRATSFIAVTRYLAELKLRVYFSNSELENHADGPSGRRVRLGPYLSIKQQTIDTPLICCLSQRLPQGCRNVNALCTVGVAMAVDLTAS